MSKIFIFFKLPKKLYRPFILLLIIVYGWLMYSFWTNEIKSSKENLEFLRSGVIVKVIDTTGVEARR
ncbi:hypothetical protein, partial [Cysteiniphilum halobium]